MVYTRPPVRPSLFSYGTVSVTFVPVSYYPFYLGVTIWLLLSLVLIILWSDEPASDYEKGYVCGSFVAGRRLAVTLLSDWLIALLTHSISHKCRLSKRLEWFVTWYDLPRLWGNQMFFWEALPPCSGPSIVSYCFLDSPGWYTSLVHWSIFPNTIAWTLNDDTWSVCVCLAAPGPELSWKKCVAKTATQN